MGSIWNKKPWWVSWLVCLVWYIVACRLFENFKNKCNEIYERDPAHFASPPELALQACLKKTGVRLELLTYIDVLLTVEEWIRVEICKTISTYAKTNNKYMNGCEKK